MLWILFLTKKMLQVIEISVQREVAEVNVRDLCSDPSWPELTYLVNILSVFLKFVRVE